MKIKSRTYLSLAASILVLVLLSGTMIVAQFNINRAYRMHQVAENVFDQTSVLNALAYEYIMQQGAKTRIQKQWQFQYQSIIKNLESEDLLKEVHEARHQIVTNLKLARQVFEKIMETYPRGPEELETRSGLEKRRQILSNRFLTLMALVRKNAAAIGDISFEKLDRTHKISNLLILFLIAGLATALMINTFGILRSIAKPISDLKKGAAILGSGNLGHRIGSYSNDEIGELASTIDTMAQDLSKITHSRDELNREVESRKKVEEELRASEEKYLDLYDHAPDMYVSVDAKTALVRECNQTLATALGLSKEEIVGAPVLKLYHPGCHEDAEKAFQEFLKTGEVHDAELQIQRKDLSTIDVSLNVTAVRDDDGNIVHSRSAWRDISDRRAAERKLAQYAKELKRSNEDLQQFAYVASHDLQEPLRMVASFTQLLAERYADKLDEKARKYIEFSVGGAKRMQKLIRDLLHFSRVTTEGTSFQKVDSGKILDSALLNLDTLISERSALIERDGLPWVVGDETQLTQLFQNLISNAIKFCKTGQPKIQISAENRGQEWIFSIKDNGIGIDPAYRDKIFLIFHRLHNQEEYPGTGLGLAVCKRILQRHQGEIWVESNPGSGSVFYFSLPASG